MYGPSWWSAWCFEGYSRSSVGCVRPASVLLPAGFRRVVDAERASNNRLVPSELRLRVLGYVDVGIDALEQHGTNWTGTPDSMRRYVQYLDTAFTRRSQN